MRGRRWRWARAPAVREPFPRAGRPRCGRGGPGGCGGTMLWEGLAEKEGADRGRLRGPGCAAGNGPQAAPASVSASSRAEALKPRLTAEPVPAGTARKGPGLSEGIFGR